MTDIFEAKKNLLRVKFRTILQVAREIREDYKSEGTTYDTRQIAEEAADIVDQFWQNA